MPDDGRPKLMDVIMGASARIEREWPSYLKATLRQGDVLARMHHDEEASVRLAAPRAQQTTKKARE